MGCLHALVLTPRCLATRRDAEVLHLSAVLRALRARDEAVVVTLYTRLMKTISYSYLEYDLSTLGISQAHL